MIMKHKNEIYSFFKVIINIKNNKRYYLIILFIYRTEINWVFDAEDPNKRLSRYLDKVLQNIKEFDSRKQSDLIDDSNLLIFQLKLIHLSLKQCLSIRVYNIQRIYKNVTQLKNT